MIAGSLKKRPLQKQNKETNSTVFDCAVFYGGKSAEHDISIITSMQVINNLDKTKYNVIPVYIRKNNSN